MKMKEGIPSFRYGYTCFTHKGTSYSIVDYDDDSIYCKVLANFYDEDCKIVKFNFSVFSEYSLDQGGGIEKCLVEGVEVDNPTYRPDGKTGYFD